MKARRVYYDSDVGSTKPDYQLETAFENTKPGEEFPLLSFDEEATGEWLLPTMVGLSLLVGGFFLGRWWVMRKTEKPTVVAGDTESALDAFGLP